MILSPANSFAWDDFNFLFWIFSLHEMSYCNWTVTFSFDLFSFRSITKKNNTANRHAYLDMHAILSQIDYFYFQLQMIIFFGTEKNHFEYNLRKKNGYNLIKFNYTITSKKNRLVWKSWKLYTNLNISIEIDMLDDYIKRNINYCDVDTCRRCCCCCCY